MGFDGLLTHSINARAASAGSIAARSMEPSAAAGTGTGRQPPSISPHRVGGVGHRRVEHGVARWGAQLEELGCGRDEFLGTDTGSDLGERHLDTEVPIYPAADGRLQHRATDAGWIAALAVAGARARAPPRPVVRHTAYRSTGRPRRLRMPGPVGRSDRADRTDRAGARSPWDRSCAHHPARSVTASPTGRRIRRGGRPKPRKAGP